MADINGSERILHIKRPSIDQDYRRVGFLLVNSWDTQTSFRPTTTRNNRGYKTERPIGKESRIEFSAIIFEDGDLAGKVGYKELKEIQDLDELIEWKLEVVNKNFADYGRCHISNLKETATHNEAMTYDGVLNVYGSPYLAVDDQPPVTPYLNSLNINAGIPTVELSWTESTDNLIVTGYEIRKAQSNKVLPILDVGNVTSYLDTGIAYFTYYSYNVRAYDAAGNRSAWSNKRLALISVPSGQPTPNYKIFQNGNTRLTQAGTPKIWQ